MTCFLKIVVLVIFLVLVKCLNNLLGRREAFVVPVALFSFVLNCGANVYLFEEYLFLFNRITHAYTSSALLSSQRYLIIFYLTDPADILM